MATIELTSTGEHEVDMESLSAWLVYFAPELGFPREIQSAAREGEMGTLVDALEVSVGTGGACTVLASALKAWLTRPKGVRVRIKITARKGSLRKSIEIEADSLVEGDLLNLLAAVGEDSGNAAP